jgi:carbon storage regulator CsrA
MLVLSRKRGESVCIGPNIEIRVLDVCGSRVRLGFSAPPKIEIQRGEISGTPRPCCGETWCDDDSVAELCSQP